MIEKLIAGSIRNPLVVIVLALVVAGLGVYSMLHTPIDAIPDLSENQVIVFADWTGRSPREVEDQVTYPLSVNLQGLAGVKDVRATSEFGFSMVNIIFEDDVDYYFARNRVLERLSTAETFLPEGVKPYLAPDATALGQVFWYTVEGQGFDLGRLRAIQDWFVRYQLASVPGVAEVASVGGYPLEYQIDVDPSRLRAYGVTLGELYSAVARSNSAVGGRVVQKGGSEYLIRSIGWIESLRDVENIVVKQVRGTPVYVSHVATVQFGSSARRSSLEKDGNEVVGGVVLMRYGENPRRVIGAIKAKIGQLQAGLPEGVHIVPFYDRTQLIDRAISTVRETLLEEMLVASLAILLVMRHVRSALVICITLPLSVLTAFILMRLLDIPSNIMSLSGIAISIGVLVDAAIVMVDQGAHTLHQHFGSERVRGDTRQLLTPALQTVGRPIFFSLMIMVISFIPVFALEGMEGRMFHPLAFTKTFALVGVSILAVTLVPAVIPLLLRGRIRGESENWLVRRVIEIYQPVLNFLMHHPWPIVWLTGAIWVVGLAPAVAGSGWTRTALRLVAALAMLAAAWAVRREEAGFRRLWRLVALVWAGVALVVWMLGAGPAGSRLVAAGPWMLGLALAAAAAGLVYALGRLRVLGQATMVASLFLAALAADRSMGRLGREFMPPLNEGTVLDMPITAPRAGITQVTDDLKARDSVLRSFPEVSMVVGKAGRAETPTDPAPIDMIETIVNLYPEAYWPKRHLRYEVARAQTEAVLAEMVRRGWIGKLDRPQHDELVDNATMQAASEFDTALRRFSLQRLAPFQKELGRKLVRTAVLETIEALRQSNRLTGPLDEAVMAPLVEQLAGEFGERLAAGPDLGLTRQLLERAVERLGERAAAVEGTEVPEPPRSAVGRWVDSVRQALGARPSSLAGEVLETLGQAHRQAWEAQLETLNGELLVLAPGTYTWQAIERLQHQAESQGVWIGGEVSSQMLQAMRRQLETPLVRNLFLWRRTREELVQEMDSVVQMPGWGNIWTQPIINRVDMLATGVRTMIGVKVFGTDLKQIQDVAQRVAEVLRKVPGAVDVLPDQIVGEGYLEIDIDREKAARYGVNVGDVQEVVETALGGRPITTTVEGRERFPVRIRYARDFRWDEQSIEQLLVSSASAAPGGAPGGAAEDVGAAMQPQQVPLAMVADVRIVEGPSMIKSENGLLRAYVQLNVRDRDLIGFVEEAQRMVAAQVDLPPGAYLEWSGQFEHQVRARRTLSLIVPAVIAIIFLILYITYKDLADSVLVLGLAVPGAIAGGILFQYVLGFNFSVAVWVGYIACFGLATENGLVMLVYLREAIDRRGGLSKMGLAEVREAVMEGAVHRTRPKLLTELTTVVGLAPMLWASGTGAEIMQPMAAPVLGGILISDEVVDLLLPVLFYRLRQWRWRRIHGDKEHPAETPAPELELVTA